MPKHESDHVDFRVYAPICPMVIALLWLYFSPTLCELTPFSSHINTSSSTGNYYDCFNCTTSVFYQILVWVLGFCLLSIYKKILPVFYACLGFELWCVIIVPFASLALRLISRFLTIRYILFVQEAKILGWKMDVELGGQLFGFRKVTTFELPSRMEDIA